MTESRDLRGMDVGSDSDSDSACECACASSRSPVDVVMSYLMPHVAKLNGPLDAGEARSRFIKEVGYEVYQEFVGECARNPPYVQPRDVDVSTGWRERLRNGLVWFIDCREDIDPSFSFRGRNRIRVRDEEDFMDIVHRVQEFPFQFSMLADLASRDEGDALVANVLLTLMFSLHKFRRVAKSVRQKTDAEINRDRIREIFKNQTKNQKKKTQL